MVSVFVVDYHIVTKRSIGLFGHRFDDDLPVRNTLANGTLEYNRMNEQIRFVVILRVSVDEREQCVAFPKRVSTMFWFRWDNMCVFVCVFFFAYFIERIHFIWHNVR